MGQTTGIEETAYINGKIYTADDENPFAEAFTVRDGRFVSVGDNSIAHGVSNRIDLKGRTVLPGLIDSHCHFLAGVRLSTLNVLELPGGILPRDLGKVIRKKAEEMGLSGDEPISAMGFDLSSGEFSAADIDREVDSRPVLVFSSDGHALLLNSEAMRVLNIDRDTVDPGEQSYFKRDNDGNPTGLVIEIPAIRICMEGMDEKKKDLRKIFFKLFSDYASLGYTTVFDASSVEEEDSEILKTLTEMDKEGKTSLRVVTSFICHPEEVPSPEKAVGMMKKLKKDHSFDTVIFNTLKIIADGTVEEHTAFLHEPYFDQPGNSGSRMMPLSDMGKIVTLAANEGFNIHIHAIGDRAAGEVLDILKSVRGCRGTRTIAHNQLYSESEKSKILSDRDIFFQTTPHWIRSDAFTLNCLGEKRYALQFPFGTMAENGVRVAFGSDSCLEEITSDAFLGMYYAEIRGDRRYEGTCFPPLCESMGRMDCIKAYTINGAALLGLDKETGSIEKGKSADFIITDRDVLNCRTEELKDTKVLETFFRGRPSFTSF